MRLLVVSDSHGDSIVLEKLKEKYEDQVDAMIHCGDSELHYEDPVLQGFAAVGGNCDLDQQFPEELIIDVNDTKVLVVHGHLHQIKSSLLTISYKAKEHNAEFVFFGHSHLLRAEMIAGTLYINPGSISLPRGGNEKTYALVEKDNQGIIVKFFNEIDEELSHLTSIFKK